MTAPFQKTALATGAFRGIGRATAVALARNGFRVIIHHGRSAKEAETAAGEIRSFGGAAETVGADPASPDGVNDLARRVRELAKGRLDGLICNAGISLAAPFETHTVEAFDNLFATNVRSH
jgi:3-oxoacyl-[acyl-carrier protein] reductase